MLTQVEAPGMLGVLLVSGLLALIAGAELFVRGASRIAELLGIPRLIIGLTVVSIGTSGPEILISTFGALEGRSDLAIGNAVGSNIFNVLFILGLSAVIVPLTVAQQLVRIDVPVLVLISLFFLGLAWNGSITRGEGAALVLLGVVYTAVLVWQARRTTAVEPAAVVEPVGSGGRRRHAWIVDLVLAAAGLTLLVLGCRWFVAGAVDAARVLGVSELVIGLTIVAAGTSLPEVATSVIASLKGERDIAVGNVIGSNIYNIFLVVGLSSVVAPAGIPVSDAVWSFDMPIMIVVAIACLPIFCTGHRIDRWEGILFLVCYLVYVVWLVIDSLADPAWLDRRGVVALVTVPLLIATAGLVIWRSRRAH